MGRALLAHLPDADQQAFLKRAPFPRLTERTIVSANELKSELELVRINGFSLVDEELELGLRSIATPVPEASGPPQVVINISVAAAQVSAAQMRTTLLPVLLEAVGRLG
jgi:IclR family pca regulon transcriptional regulator